MEELDAMNALPTQYVSRPCMHVYVCDRGIRKSSVLQENERRKRETWRLSTLDLH